MMFSPLGENNLHNIALNFGVFHFVRYLFRKIDMSQNKFEAAGNIERQKMTQLFHQFGITSYNFTSSTGYDRIEGYYTGTTGTEYVFEVKCRNLTTSAYTNTIIEKDKVDAVLKESKESNHQPILFFFFEDGKCLYQKLDHETFYSWYWEKAPITTMGKRTMVDKQFVPFFLNPQKIIILK